MSQDRRRWVISGGIGSGKSAVRRLLDEAGYFTIDADSVGHEVLATGGPAFREVALRWPGVLSDGEIDRSELATIVFADGAQLDELQRITHPHIFGMIEKRIQGIPDPIAVEIPLIDHGLEGNWCRLIVDCADDLRLSRLLNRGVTRDDALSRMRAQPTRAEWLVAADIVVPNHGTPGELQATMNELLTRL